MIYLHWPRVGHQSPNRLITRSSSSNDTVDWRGGDQVNPSLTRSNRRTISSVSSASSNDRGKVSICSPRDHYQLLMAQRVTDDRWGGNQLEWWCWWWVVPGAIIIISFSVPVAVLLLLGLLRTSYLTNPPLGPLEYWFIPLSRVRISLNPGFAYLNDAEGDK